MSSDGRCRSAMHIPCATNDMTPLDGYAHATELLQNYTGRRCAFKMDGIEGSSCYKPPMHGKRFCHQHIEYRNRCGAYRPIDQKIANLQPNAGVERYNDAFYTMGRSGIPMGGHCPRDAEADSLACADAHCQAIIRHYGSRQQKDDNLSEDVSTADKRQRERCWQLVHQLCWVGHHEVVGYFVYVCPCGALSTTHVHHVTLQGRL